MKKDEFIQRYGQAAYDRVKEQANARQKAKKTNGINESIKQKQVVEEEPDDPIEVSGYTLEELKLLNRKYRIKRRDFLNTTFEEVPLSNILNEHKRDFMLTYKVLNLRGEDKFLTVQTLRGDELIKQFSEAYGDIYALMDKLRERDFRDFYKMRTEFLIEMNNIRVARAMKAVEEVDCE